MSPAGNPDRPTRRRAPRTPAEAQAKLLKGNRSFAHLLDSPGRARVIPLDPSDVGHGVLPGVAPVQRPFAAVLGCSDARVPIETIFQQRSNDLFVVRVAGNGVGSGCLGSLRYAADHFPASLRLVVVLGHSQCGAVTSAVDVFLRPARYLTLAANYPLRSIVDSILVAVRSASLALEAVHGEGVTRRPGYRAALVETAVAINAGVAAYKRIRQREVGVYFNLSPPFLNVYGKQPANTTNRVDLDSLIPFSYFVDQHSIYQSIPIYYTTLSHFCQDLNHLFLDHFPL